MKILVINWQDIRNPLGGGAEVHLHNIFSRLAQQGHDVTLLCSSFPGAPAAETIDGIRIVRTGSRSLFNFHVPFAYWRLSSSGAFDVVVDDLNKLPFFTPLFVRRPLWAIAHHLFGRSIFVEATFPVALYVYVMERIALQVYHRCGVPFFVVSPSTRKELLDHGFAPEKLALAYNCVDAARYRLTGVQKSATPLIGYFGRLKRYKCIDQLIRALPEVRRHIPDVHAVIVGDGDDRNRLEALARDTGVHELVKFEGFVTEERKVELLQQMWIKVSTSTKEGWGLTVIEANACGTPVIASDVPGLRDAVRDNETGLLYRHGDIADLAGKIMTLLSNASVRDRLRDAALKWARSFSWEDTARNVAARMEETLARRS
jgi:glycosyltransferase involved in cell wall biosynthesis